MNWASRRLMSSRASWTLRRLLGRQGFQLRREPSLVAFLESRRIDMVLDVGANTGQFASQLRALGYRGRIVSFEPVSSAYEQLANKAAKDSGWEARRLALGDCPGRQDIHVSRNTVYSSFRPLLDSAVEFDPDAAVMRTETVEVARLDDIFEEFAARRVFLKVDTQGFERAVIAGASKSLTGILGVQLELAIGHLYAASLGFEDGIALMREAGFVVAQTRTVNVFEEDRASAVEIDCIFRRVTDQHDNIYPGDVQAGDRAVPSHL